jgi:hypothetical protein
VFGDRRVQQGVPSSQSARRSILRDEGDAQAVHLRKPEGEFGVERERYLLDVEPPLRGKVEPLLRDPPFRVLCARV